MYKPCPLFVFTNLSSNAICISFDLAIKSGGGGQLDVATNSVKNSVCQDSSKETLHCILEMVPKGWRIG